VNERRAYCGLLDDFAIRHNDGFSIRKLGDLNEHLIFSVIAGDPLTVNDGYLLMNPAVRDAIAQPARSPFRELVRGGFVRILSRNGGDLAGLAQRMADDGITSAKRLLTDPWYDQHYAPALADWSAELNSRPYTWSQDWPGHRTDVVYGKLASRILDSLIGAGLDERDQLSRFQDELGDRVSSRTAWENIADTLVRARQLSSQARRVLMKGANEAYQYAWGCALADSTSPVSVQTRVTQFLAELDLPANEAATRGRTDIRLFVPNVKVATKGIGEQWNLLAQVAGSAVHPAAEAKQDFRAALIAYYTGQGVNKRQMERVARDYSATLADVFGRGDRTQTGVDLIFTASSIGASVAAFAGASLLLGPPGLAIGVGLAAAGFSTAHVKPVHNLISRLGRTKPHRWIEERNSVDPQSSVSSFEVDPAKAAAVLDGVPRYRRPA